MGMESPNFEPNIDTTQRIDDVDKAHEIAAEGDYFRSQAALLRKQAEGILNPEDRDDEIRQRRILELNKQNGVPLPDVEALNAAAENYRNEALEKDALAEKAEYRAEGNIDNGQQG